ncbi:MAG: hypothetical protein IPK19_32180 [Chloroflexi bacterium]|nr:hypothetical protein [Chloroflexota bacterium]
MLATLLGALTHTLVGGDARRLAILLMAGWIGFALGQVIGAAFQVEFGNVGTLRLVPAILSAFIALTFASLLTSGTRPRRMN